MRSELFVVAAGLAMTAACGSSTSSYGSSPPPSCTPSATKVCMIGGNQFSPANLTITHGMTVTWENGSGVPHTVTSSVNSTESFNSGNPPAGVASGGTFGHTFATAGTFHYYCQYHGLDGNPPTGMAGIITVQ